MLDYADFQEVLTRGVTDGKSELDELLRFVRQVHGGDVLEDDFSVIRVSI